MDQELSLEQAVEIFSKDQIQDNYNNVIMALYHSVIKGSVIIVPVEIKVSLDEELRIEPAMVQATDGRYYYVANTSPKDADKFSEECDILMKVEDLLFKAYNDDEMGGICLDPMSGGNCFIPVEYIRFIIDLINEDKV
jgi:hypothetical protein